MNTTREHETSIARLAARVAAGITGRGRPVVEPPAPALLVGDLTRSARVSRLAASAARRLRDESPAWQALPELVVASRLKTLSESVFEAVVGGGTEGEAEAAPTPPGIDASDLLLELLAVERIVEELLAPPGTSEGLDEERRGAIRCELRRAASRSARTEGSEPEPPAVDRRVAALLEELPEAIMVADEEGVVRYANGRVRDVYGIEPAASQGRNIADVMTAPGVLLRVEDPDAFLEATLRFLRLDGEACEDLFRHVDGPAFLRRSVPVGEAGRSGRLLITTNVTALRQRNRSVGGPDRQPEWSASAPVPLDRPRLRLVSGGRTD